MFFDANPTLRLIVIRPQFGVFLVGCCLEDYLRGISLTRTMRSVAIAMKKADTINMTV